MSEGGISGTISESLAPFPATESVSYSDAATYSVSDDSMNTTAQSGATYTVRQQQGDLSQDDCRDRQTTSISSEKVDNVTTAADKPSELHHSLEGRH